MDVDDDASTTGARLRQIRNARDKSLRVIAGLAGISKSRLSQLERGERALDSRSETVALANALGIAPSDLTGLPVPAPGNGRLPGRNLRKIDLAHDYEPALEIVTGIFARKGERERYADDHPLNLLWNAFAEATPTRSVPAVLPG